MVQAMKALPLGSVSVYCDRFKTGLLLLMSMNIKLEGKCGPMSFMVMHSGLSNKGSW